MNKTQEALKMAIEAFEPEESTWWSHTKMSKAYKACKEALAECEQAEQVGKVYNGNAYWAGEVPENDTPLFTSPQEHEWVGLSDEEVQTVFELGHHSYKEFAKAIEAKLKELNT
jgi:hypothetical protein